MKNSSKKILLIAVALSAILNILFFINIFSGYGLEKKLFQALKKEKPVSSTIAPIIPGRWHAAAPQDETLSKEIDRLKSIGYLQGTAPAPTKKNVTVYDKALAYDGVNLYNAGHGPEAILIDMQGNELHKWRFDFRSAWPDAEIPSETTGHEYWRRVHVFENGDLLAIYEGLGLIKIDKKSNLLWKYSEQAHHDVYVTPEGTIYVLIREINMHNGTPFLEDFVAVLNADGQEIRRVSILQCIRNSFYSPLVDFLDLGGDFMHTNTLEILDAQMAPHFPAFKQGNILVSLLFLGIIGIIDMESEKMVWSLSNMWRLQHQPSFLPNGNMLIFDNQGLGKKSRVVEFNPFTQEVPWEYVGTPGNPFYSHNCGSCEKLPNGNVLISETSAGRAFEVTPEKQIVWEFIVPWRTGENDELIASLFELIRLRPDFPMDWLTNSNP